MTRTHPPRARLLAHLGHLAALVLLLEEWFWDAGARVAATIGAWPPLKWLELRVRALPPYAALAAFVLPGLLLFPVKILALVAIARGHAMAGIATIVVAKLGGAAVVARLYMLTLPQLLSLQWFARLHAWFMDLKERCIEHLRASQIYRNARRLAQSVRSALPRLAARIRASFRPGGRRARRRKTTEKQP